MLLVGFVVAILVTLAFAIEFYKLPLTWRIWCGKRYLLVDMIMGWGAFAMLGFSVVGIVAAALNSLFVSLYLEWYKRTGLQKDLAKLEELRQNKPKFNFYKCFIRGCAEFVLFWRRVRA